MSIIDGDYLDFFFSVAKNILQDKDIHLWLTGPKELADPTLLASYQLLLSADEKKKAGPLVFRERSL